MPNFTPQHAQKNRWSVVDISLVPRTSDVPIAVTISCKIVQWRATADEDGHYCFAVAL
jgi:hypothetical protein